MSELSEIECTRLRFNFMDSPTFADESGPGFSPVTHLALNLNDTNLSATPRRKLPLCNLEESIPTHHVRLLQSDLSDNHTGSPFSEKLLKNALRLPCGGSLAGPLGAATTPSAPTAARARPPAASASALRGDKENCADDDAALSPASTPSPRKFASPLRTRLPLEDHDPNSQDSGYSPVSHDRDEQEHKQRKAFRFTEPLGAAPRRHLSGKDPGSASPPFGTHFGPPFGPPFSPPFGRTLSSSSGSGGDSLDDGFMDLPDMDRANENTPFPSGIGNLLSCPLKEQNSIKRDIFATGTKPRQDRLRRSLSLTETSSRVVRYPFALEREGVVSLNDTGREFKRPQPPSEISLMQSLKRPKFNAMPIICEDSTAKSSHCLSAENVPSVRLQRSFSCTEATIKRALQRSSQEPDLIGDFSKPFILPLMEGRHQDLKTISSETLAKLITGEFHSLVDSYTIIDCRYPYEFNGGHIKGAKNIFTQDQIYKEFVDSNKSKPVPTVKRNILIFHCEFSSERGPKLSRFLRNSDRVLNKESYPALHYPEVYLLHGGYKEFFEKHRDLCEPCSYKPMLDPDHEADLRHFRAKTKSGDSKNRLALRSNLKRLGL